VLGQVARGAGSAVRGVGGAAGSVAKGAGRDVVGAGTFMGATVAGAGKSVGGALDKVFVSPIAKLGKSK